MKRLSICVSSKTEPGDAKRLSSSHDVNLTTLVTALPNCGPKKMRSPALATGWGHAPQGLPLSQLVPPGCYSTQFLSQKIRMKLGLTKILYNIP